MLNTALFDYTLPEDLVAQTPAARRDQSRLMVVERASRTVSHHAFSDLPDFLGPGDKLFRNTVTVLPARLRAVRPGGGRVECLLLRPAGDDQQWRCLLKPGRRLPAGASFASPNGSFQGRVVGWEPDGTAVVQFETRDHLSMATIAQQEGEIPLPPYIRRTDPSSRESDRERYQTVYADPGRPVAVAAPTAGLHFTPELLETLSAKGVLCANLTLHVGLGTFRPISTPTVEEHVIHREWYEVPVDTQRALFPEPGAQPGRRVAVGTTTVRSIEDFLAGSAGAGSQTHAAEAGIFIHPPFAFRGVDALITNFHQPRSTLLCLVAAFLSPAKTDGIAWLQEIYAEAIARRYRFFSYGDAMLIL